MIFWALGKEILLKSQNIQHMNDPLGITSTNLFEIPKWLWVAKQSSSQPIIWQRPYGRLHRLTIHGGKRIHGIPLIQIHWSLKNNMKWTSNWNYRTYVTPLPTKHHIFTMNVWWSRERLKGIQCHFPFIQCFKFKVVWFSQNPKSVSSTLCWCAIFMMVLHRNWTWSGHPVAHLLRKGQKCQIGLWSFDPWQNKAFLGQAFTTWQG